MKDVEGKTAFITGGASGVGFGMVRAFLGAGMKVVIADSSAGNLDQSRETLRGNNQVHFIQVDVTDRAAMARAADEAEAVFGKVHVLCNNAGIAIIKPMDTATYEDWDHTMSVNLGGVINGVMSFIPKLKAHGEGGHIVNTSSMGGLLALPGGGGIYSTSKFAVRGLSEALRLGLSADNVGVSVLFPGLTRSRISAGPNAQTDPGLDPNAVGMDPLKLGEAVLKGIRNNEPFIIAHGEFKAEVQELFDEILAAFPDNWDDADPKRMEFEARRREMTALAKQGKRPDVF